MNPRADIGPHIVQKMSKSNSKADMCFGHLLKLEQHRDCTEFYLTVRLSGSRYCKTFFFRRETKYDDDDD